MRKSFIAIIVVVAVVVAAGVGVLTWWLVKENQDDETINVIEIDGNGFGQLPYKAAFTSIPKVGDMFWWFYPTTSNNATAKPILLWLDGVLGGSPSLLANFGMLGPYDINMNRREDSWIRDFNLLFVDALGTGFSVLKKPFPQEITLEQNAEYLQYTLDSFYGLHEEYKNTSLYIIGQGHGAQIAVSLAKRLHQIKHKSEIKGVLIGNGIISPALVLTQLGTYLEQWGYVDSDGRESIEQLSKDCNDLVNQKRYHESFTRFLDIGKIANDEANALAINMGHIVEKLTNDTNSNDYSFYQTELRYVFPGIDTTSFMNEVVSPSIGVPNAAYDSMREDALDLFRNSFMRPADDLVEYLLRYTDLSITFFNGNLDAISNTPGQLAWIENLLWYGQQDFKKSPRQTFVISNIIQGYYRQIERLAFYWINAAGLLTPVDSPAAVRRLIERATYSDD